MNSGWIKLYRKLKDNKLWLCESFTRGQAWVDLLLLANHEDNFFYCREHKIEVKRGEVGWSQIKLAERWKWSRTKTRKFLNDLEKEQQVRQQLSHSYSIIQIVNYDDYQEKKTTGHTTEKQQQDTNKNDKNDKNNNKEKIYKKESFDFKKSLIEIGIEKNIVEDWLKVRKTKKASNTKTAFERIKNEIELSGLSANECIKIAAERSWQGFNHKWLNNEKNWSNNKGGFYSDTTRRTIEKVQRGIEQTG